MGLSMCKRCFWYKKELKNKFLGQKTINLDFSTTIITEIRGK
jgi:hypothetical protein